MGLSQALDEVIMEQGQKLLSGQRNKIMAHCERCQLVLLKDGNLISKRKIDDEWGVSWSSGASGLGLDYYAQLESNGRLIVYDDGTEKYSTNSYPRNCNSSTKLVFDNNCRLKVLCDDEAIWENIKVPPFEAGQVLQKGEIFTNIIQFGAYQGLNYGFTLHYQLELQHDCNLVQYVGTDRADRRGKVWSAFRNGPNYDNCYLYLDKGAVKLYKGTFDSTPPTFKDRTDEVYWSTAPYNWFDSSIYTNATQLEELTTNYEVLLDPTGNPSFHWRCCHQPTWPMR